MDRRELVTAILAYGRAEHAAGEGTGNYEAVAAALDVLLAKAIPTPGKEMAHYCSWGRHPMSDADEALARAGCWISHGVCPEHAHLLDGLDRQVVR